MAQGHAVRSTPLSTFSHLTLDPTAEKSGWSLQVLTQFSRASASTRWPSHSERSAQRWMLGSEGGFKMPLISYHEPLGGVVYIRAVFSACPQSFSTFYHWLWWSWLNFFQQEALEQERIVQIVGGSASSQGPLLMCLWSLALSLYLDVTDEMLSFFLTLFRGLRVQMGVPFTEQIIQTFLNMFTR